MGCLSSSPANTEENTKASIDGDSIAEIKPIGDVMKEYQVGRTLGSGASCRVVEGFLKSDPNVKVAIKMMDKEMSVAERLYKREVRILTDLTPDPTKPHESILPFVGHGEDKNSYYILTSLLTGGEVFDRIVSQNEIYKITEKKAVDIVKQMLIALKYCHDRNIVHRDLKPENFIFATNDPDSTVVLIDFGCARVVKDNEEINDVLGTAYYMAPELAIAALENYSKNGKKVGDGIGTTYKSAPRNGAILRASDVWSIGVIAYVMMTGQAPYRGRDNIQIFHSIVKKKLAFPKNDARYHNKLELNAHFVDFISKVLVKEPSKRLTIDECLQHPWVRGVDAKDYQLNADVLKYLKQFRQQSKLKKEITRVLAMNMTDEVGKSVFRHFERIDSDNDGFLNEDELIILLLDMGYGKADARKQCKLILENADKNKDGVLSYDEFKEVWYRKVLKSNDAYIQRVFDVFDSNGDGHIDANELNEILFPKDEAGGDKKDSDEAEPGAAPQSSSEDEDEDVKDEDLGDMGDLGDPDTMKKLKSLISEVDENGDGKISFEEFKNAMKEDIDNNRFNARKMSYGGFVGSKYE